MSWIYRGILRPIFFTQDPERIHDLVMRSLGLCSRSAAVCGAFETIMGAPKTPVELFGLTFPNPVGLAAGMDKYGEAVPVWKGLGFGHVELGAVTMRAQAGNSRPRIFRVVKNSALINRMGFNNPGAETLAKTLVRLKENGRWPAHPVGINLGKSRIVPLEKAAEDYAGSFKALRGVADFFVLNISSPNTPQLRRLQDKSALDEVLSAIQEINMGTPAGGEAARGAGAVNSRRIPFLVKIDPDLPFEAIDELVGLALERGVDGIVATNTTLMRPFTRSVRLSRIYAEDGGLSGEPLRARSTEVIAHVFKATNGKLPIIGVGGVFSVEHAWEKITAGASLVQVYTGFIYEGPFLVRKIVKGLRKKLINNGMHSLSEAVGIGNH
ncbi:MAG: quinone-dependent dihydroorotate dehydrogenase [Verrucomicrobia bacterium]|nr:quinone-dependent dihydroorotate dehydrogenase [Verrucomicrobiota bacterium]